MKILFLALFDGSTNTLPPPPDYFLQNTDVFDKLLADGYWSGTEYADNIARAWGFSFSDGGQNAANKNPSLYGLAVRPGQVSFDTGGDGQAPEPEPATMLLFGTGLAGLGGFRLRRKKK